MNQRLIQQNNISQNGFKTFDYELYLLQKLLWNSFIQSDVDFIAILKIFGF